MTVERTTLLAIPISFWENDFQKLAVRAERAAERFLKAAPGDRREAIRYEGLCRDLERKAREWQRSRPDLSVWDLDEEESEVLDHYSNAPNTLRHPWSRSPVEISQVLQNACSGISELQGHVKIFQLRHVFDPGVTHLPPPTDRQKREEDALEVWRIAHPVRDRFEALERRWREQLEQAVENQKHPLLPSGVNDIILSRELREFVEAKDGNGRVDARVVYRDGSKAAPFPLRALQMREEGTAGLPVLRVALMSMRHAEMDPIVDAAWLRNKVVSGIKRPAAETDDFIYKTSLGQLEVLCKSKPVSLHVYQTGLETAVIGFYRAVTDHLLVNPGSIEVIPYYHHKPPWGSGTASDQNCEATYERGKPWATQ